MIRVLRLQQRVSMHIYMRGSAYNTKATAVTTSSLPKFRSLGLSSRIVQAFSKTAHSLQIQTPTQIQTLGIPAALTGKVVECQCFWIFVFCNLSDHLRDASDDNSGLTCSFQPQSEYPPRVRNWIGENLMLPPPSPRQGDHTSHIRSNYEHYDSSHTNSSWPLEGWQDRAFQTVHVLSSCCRAEN